MDRFVVISGASGGGKSTLVDELRTRGCNVVAEAGRRLLHGELAVGGTALPWTDPTAFLRRLLSQSIADHDAAKATPGRVFFDRSIVDAASGLAHRTGKPVLADAGRSYRYHARVFLAPPWPDIYVMDDERRHSFAAAEAEYLRLARDYPRLGYEIVHLPKLPVADRADWLLAALGGP